jgi:hypothetical protein
MLDWFLVCRRPECGCSGGDKGNLADAVADCPEYDCDGCGCCCCCCCAYRWRVVLNSALGSGDVGRDEGFELSTAATAAVERSYWREYLLFEDAGGAARPPAGRGDEEEEGIYWASSPAKDS